MKNLSPFFSFFFLLLVIGCVPESLEEQLENINPEILESRSTENGCTFDLTETVEELEELFNIGDCLEFNPPIPDDNLVFVECDSLLTITPSQCGRPLEPIELDCECNCGMTIEEVGSSIENCRFTIKYDCRNGSLAINGNPVGIPNSGKPPIDISVSSVDGICEYEVVLSRPETITVTWTGENGETCTETLNCD